MSYELHQMREQLADLAWRHQDLETQLETECSARIDQATAQSLVGKVSRPEQLVKILRADGRLVEQYGELYLRNNGAIMPLSSGLDELLQSAEYTHFQPSTPDSKATSGAADPAKPVGRILQGGDRQPTDAEIAAALANPTQSELFAELEEMMGQPAPQPGYDSVRPQAQMQPSTTGNMPSDVEIKQALNNPQKLEQLLAKYA